MDFILTAVRGVDGVSLPFYFCLYLNLCFFLTVIRIHKFLDYLLYDFLSVKNDVNVPSKSKAKKRNFFVS
jgi:hypothetical protein